MSTLLRDILYEISEKLRENGISNCFSEARALVAIVIDRPVQTIHPAINIELTDEQLAYLAELVQRRLSGEPLQLITGMVGFHNCLLHSEKGVFIPRIETEILVDRALKYLDEIAVDQTARVLDLATGCGAIPIALALSSPRHQYYGVDISEKAVELARKNAKFNQTHDKTVFYQGDYYDPVRGWEGIRFDLIVSNPPYIKTDDIPNLDKEVKDWDPHNALDGSIDGLEHYRIILREMNSFLAPDGIALFEIDPSYVKPMTDIVNDFGFEVIDVIEDYDGNERIMEIAGK